MKIRKLNENNINNFFKVIDSCEGKIELVSEDLRVNLKSNFAKYVSLANILFDKENEEIEILAYNQEDVMRLMNFMMNDK